MTTQQGAVDIFQTLDGGEIAVEGGYIRMDGGITSAVYLSLFGGNLADPGASDASREWWGNKSEQEPARKYRSRTQYALLNTKQSSANIGRVVDAAKLDLAWMVSEKVASSVTVSASIPGLNRIKFNVTVEADGTETEITITANWKAEL